MTRILITAVLIAVGSFASANAGSLGQPFSNEAANGQLELSFGL